MDRENEFEKRVSRRRFFNVAGWTGLCAFLGSSGAAAARFFYPKVLYEPASTFNAGKPEEYPAPTGNEQAVVDERWKKSQRVWMVRNREGIYAVVAVCTHLGCTPNWFPTEVRFKCPCHGSNFNPDGEVIAGPAPEPLFRAKIELAPDGSMIVTTGLLGIRRANLQAQKKTLGVFWTEEEKEIIWKPPYFLQLKA
ncbi:MAG: ubiquinol-cytochrome c reductase iron-sulfur subunit [Nitrospinae bacterium]|nr:ubiquinol-cytochrome c reductase iron-sulfur subunit [Nitrospinota bacterium]MBI3814309.1 ubiquinol-cytochrome c reductase iron-sulfur subunit [Nitrospinota bacterium]